MAITKFKIPTDKQIWAEVDARLETIPAIIKARGQFDRQKLFDEKKAWYKDTPKREKELAAHRKKEALKQAAEAKAKADADAAYLSIRKAQGKPVLTNEQIKMMAAASVKIDFETITQKDLYEKYEIFEQLVVATKIYKKVTHLKAVTRKLTFDYLSQTYGLYRKIRKSEVASQTFEEIRAILWNKFKIKTHYDIPQSSLLLKWVFEGLPEKTIHLYTRSIQLADGYDTEEKDFVSFIKELGGMEKIRKAYATVIAVDAGKWQPLYEKDAEYSASRNTLLSKKPFKVVQLTGPEAAAFNNDIFKHFCLVAAHIDPMGQLELYGQWPASAAIANEMIAAVSAKAKKAGTPSWIVHKAKASALSADRLREKLITKQEKQDAKDKKAAAVAKKNAATAKPFSKQREKLN
jgi:hypothetical protein